MSVIPLVLPDFLLIGLGWLLFHKLKFSAEFFQGAEQLVYFVLFPALLFHSITQPPLNLDSASTLAEASLAAIVIGWALRLSLVERQALLLFGSLPTASSAHVLAARMSGNGRLAALIMSLGTLLPAITIPFWIMVGPHRPTLARHHGRKS